MKKIIILGGGSYQVPLIEAAKSQGYYVVLCDFRENIPGKRISDVHYQVDTLSYEDIIEVCKKENPNGIITNSEPAMPNCTKVANDLGLISNSYNSIMNLMSKHLFRKIQSLSGCFCPNSFVISNFKDLIDNVHKLKFPILLKPSENSGTRGTKRIDKYNIEELKTVYEECYEFSRNKMVEVEEFVEMTSLKTIEGEIFIYKGDILWDGLFYTYRSQRLPMLPMTYVAPFIIDDAKLAIIKQTITKIFSSANIIYGEFNIEGYFNKDGQFFVIEINARQGGLLLPKFVYRSTGIDYYKLLVTTAVGDDAYWNYLKTYKREKKYVTNHAVFSTQNGLYDGLYIEESIKEKVVGVLEFKEKGASLRVAKNATDIVALVELQFDGEFAQNELSSKLDKFILPKYK